MAASLTVYLVYVGRTIAHATSVFLPPDAAHALGEADVLLGHGVLKFTHPPAFAVFVAAGRGLFGPVDGVLAAYLAGLALLWLGIYALLRQWLPPLPAVVGTMTGMALPLVAELVGWGGGAQLLGLGFGVATLAAFERWARTGRGGPLVGVGLGLTALSHPFALLALLACLAVRWLAELWPARGASDSRPSRPSGPATWRGGILAGITAAPFVLAGAAYYGGVSSPGAVSLALPSLHPFFDLMSWATRENRLLLIACLGSLGTALFARGRGAIAIAASLAGVIVLPVIFVHAEAGYLTRSLYYLPVIVALGVAWAWEALATMVAAHLDRRPRLGVAVVAAVLLPAFVAIVGLGPRLRVAMPYYTAVNQPEVDAISALRGAKGDVATSWTGASVAAGEGMSWYVSGLAGRHAYGPSGRWIGAQPDEQRDGIAMQQALSGEVGIDAGGLQLAGRGSEL
ncbi:MAG TPA: hypothetical protein VGM93_03095, partial [Acidimicrobiales bacterium]